MASYNENQLLTVVKAYARSNPLPIDASSVWDDKTSADSYAKQANAYGGQIITAKVDGKYKAYVLQGSAGSYTLEPIETDLSSIQQKEYVIVGTRPGSGQQQGVIYIDNNVGYIWNGSEWKKVFEDVSASITDFEDRIGQLETDITTKANIANPNFTGTVKVEGKELATKEYADSIVAAAKSDVPIMIDDDHPFPSTSYKAGQKYVVAKAGEYFGQKCEIGDVILIVKDYAADGAGNSDAVILQSNIDGAVTSPDSAVDGEIVVFSGATGKVIKSSKINMTSLNDAVSKAHTHANKTQLDTYDKTQTELLNAAAQDAQSKVDTLSETLTTEIDKKANKATTLSGYGITDAASKTHTHVSGDITSLDASKLTGTIDIARLPQGALERCVVVEDDEARLALTTGEVQKGDTVKITSTGKMYFVVDDTQLDDEAGYEVYTAGTATSVPWSGITGKPSTFTPSTHTHTTAQVTGLDTALAGKATSAQGAKADTAVQSVKISGNDTELKQGTSVTLPAYPTTLPASDVSAWAKAASKPTYTKSEVGLGNVTNDKQVKGLASGTTAGHVVTWGEDGYTVKDSGFTIASNVPANAKFTDTTYSAATTSTLGLVKSASGTNKVAVAGDGTMSVSAVSTDILSQGSNTLILNGGGVA